MDSVQASNALRALSSQASTRSKIAQVRDVMPAIEEAAAAGVAMNEIWRSLTASGLDMSLGGFESAVSVLRKRNGTVAPRKRLAVPAATATTTAKVEPKPASPAPPAAPAASTLGGPSAPADPPVLRDENGRRINPYPPGSTQAFQWALKYPRTFEEAEAAMLKKQAAERAARAAARAAATVPSTPSAPAPPPTGSPASAPDAG